MPRASMSAGICAKHDMPSCTTGRGTSPAGSSSSRANPSMQSAGTGTGSIDRISSVAREVGGARARSARSPVPGSRGSSRRRSTRRLRTSVRRRTAPESIARRGASRPGPRRDRASGASSARPSRRRTHRRGTGRPRQRRGRRAQRPAARWSIIVCDGSTATTRRSRGSYEPVPAPTLTTLRASPSAAWIAASMRGSAVRVARVRRADAVVLRGTRRGAHGSARSNATISIAVAAASSPLWPSLPPMRSNACSRVVDGQDAEDHRDAGVEATRVTPAAHSPATYSKCGGVAPDDRADADHRVDIATGREPLRDERQLERARAPTPRRRSSAPCLLERALARRRADHR